MSDLIRAALITGSVQVIIGSLTMSVAISALNSWRRNALGTRQLELAEQCLQAVWRLDEHIKAARFLLIPGNLDEIKSNDRVRQIHTQSHERALAAMRACYVEFKELKNLLMLSEVYLGEFPKTRMPHTARFIKRMSYTTEQDYDEIIGQLLVCLMNISPDWLENIEVNESNIKEFDKSAEMFYGFAYEYEEDDYSVRLRVSRTAFERHVSRILRRRRLSHRFWEKLGNTVSDHYRNKFKPVTINQKPLRKFMEEQSKRAKGGKA